MSTIAKTYHRYEIFQRKQFQSTRLIFLFKKEFLREEEDSFVMIVYICMGVVKAVMTLEVADFVLRSDQLSYDAKIMHTQSIKSLGVSV